MKILLATDAWTPQLNGVVRTLTKTVAECKNLGHEVKVIEPGLGFKTMPLPTYPEIPLALFPRKKVEQIFLEFQPEAVHIATEGPLGLAMRKVCFKHKFPFTTSYHTKYPEYVSARFPIPLSVGYYYMRWFHNSAGAVMVTTPSMRDELQKNKIHNIVLWARGVDIDLFNPSKRTKENFDSIFAGLERPIYINVGRIAVEKNIEAFLKLDLPGSKIVVGAGPQLDELKQKFPDTVFPGAKFGDELAQYFANADVFVFPSLTDTFGLVILESMACGTPVAAFHAPGPKDLIPGSNAGMVGDDLQKNALECLNLDRKKVRDYAEKFSWNACAQDFLNNLSPLPPMERKRFWRRLRLPKRKK